MRVLINLAVLISCQLPLFAQSAGKIVGVGKDKRTGDFLPGVNVSLEGTTMGGVTDVDGYFVILNVPVGVYDLRANYLGYSDLVLSGIRVSANTTTEVKFELEETTIEGNEVVVITEKPLVEKHVTQSVALVTSEDLENIPVRGFNNVMALQNSVAVQDGLIHIRGGRNEEVGFYIDGVSSVNPFDNTQSIYIIQEAVEEFQVLAGGYTAEFGGANSGIIRTEYKTGARDWHFSLDFQTDRFANAEEGGTFLNTHSYGHHIGVGAISGPLGTDRIRLFAAIENTEQDDRLRRFSEGFEFTRIDINIANPDVAAGNPDTVTFRYPDGFTPQNGLERWAVNGTIFFDYLPVSFRLSGSWSDQKTFDNNRPQTQLLNSRVGFRRNNSYLISGKMTHFLSSKTFYNISLSYFRHQLDHNDTWFGNDWQSWFNGNKISEYTNGEVQYRKVIENDEVPWVPPHNYIFNGFEFPREGTAPGFIFRLRRQKYIGGAFDFISQIGKHHELKFGFNTRRYTMSEYQIWPDNMKLTEQFESGNPASVPPGLWATQGFFGGYGYDIYGNEIDEAFSYGDSIFIDGAKHPQFTALYLQDKIEFNDIIINAGLRWDYIDTEDQRLINPRNPEVNLRSGLVVPEAFEDVNPISQVSPRLGVSFPVSEKTVFYGQYGKYIQTWELNDLYFGSFEFGRRLQFGARVGFDLGPIRTTSYELGFRQQLGRHAAFDLTGFYRNDKGHITRDRQEIDVDAAVGRYNRHVNGDFITTKGLELKFTLRRVNRLQGQFNYTYTDGQGTGSDEFDGRRPISGLVNRPTTINPLDFSQQHAGAIILDYRFGQNDGGPIFQRLGLNTLLTFDSGHPFTFVDVLAGGQIDPYNAGVNRPTAGVEPVNSSTTPWNTRVDLRIDKTVRLFKSLDATLYARITNLFNTRNELNVYEGTGSTKDDGFLSRPEHSQSIVDANGGEEYIELYRQINLVNGGAYHSEVGNELWGHPRQIFLGVKLSY